LVSHTEGGTQNEDIREHGAEEDIWSKERGKQLEAAVDYLMRGVIICTPRTILEKVIRQRRMKCTGHVVCMRVK
jgi:hypothetical protein